MARHMNSISDNSVNGAHRTSGNSSLVRVEHVRRVSPDRHQATVSNRNNSILSKAIRIGTWNVQTMFQEGKLENIKQEMRRMKINILGLSEVRWQGAGKITSDEFTIVYSRGDSNQRGVGILIDAECSKALKGFWSVNDRVIVVKIRGKPFDIGIIQAYASTADKDMAEIESFYEDIEKAIKQLKPQDIKIIIGDFNTKVGNDRIDTIVGSFGLGEINEQGEKPVECCKEYNFVVMNIWFENHPRRCWTWKSPGDKTRNQIEYILIQEIYHNSITSCRSMPGADCGSDHIPVLGTMKVKLKKLKRSKREPKLQLSLLEEDENLKNKYRIRVKNKFEVLDALPTAEERWQKMKESIKEVADEHIPFIEKKANKKWMTTEILVLMEDRREVKKNEQKYSEICKFVKKKCNEAKEKWINDQCIEIEKQTDKDSKYMHQKIKEVTGKNPLSKTGCLKSKDGQILMGKNEILNRWSEYIEDLYNDERCPAPPISNGIEGSPILA